MQFRVVFSGNGGYAVVHKSRECGLRDLDRCRVEIGPGVDQCNVRGYVEGVVENPEVSVTEEQARESGAFGDTRLVLVSVPEGWLNDCCTERLEDHRRCGESITIRKSIAPLRAFAKWREANFALVIK